MITTEMIIMPRLYADDDEGRRGSIWVREPGKPAKRYAIESSSKRSLQLELMTFLERFAGKTLSVSVFQCTAAESVTACAAIAHLVHHTVTKKDVGSQAFYRRSPFAREDFRGATTINYQPTWLVPAEKFDAMRGQDLENYNCPSYE